MKFATALALLAALALPGCKQEPATKTAAAAADKPGVMLSGGTLRLPAVTGNPGAAYFTISNTAASGSVSVTGVSIKGAGKAEMHGTSNGAMSAVDRLDVEAGSTLRFAPGGLHVMAFDLDGSLAPGKTTTMTVGFADGSKAELPLTIEAAGAAAHGAGH